MMQRWPGAWQGSALDLLEPGSGAHQTAVVTVTMTARPEGQQTDWPKYSAIVPLVFI